MTEERLLEIIGHLDDDLVEQAWEKTKVNRRISMPWKEWALSAACITLVVVAVCFLPQRTKEQNSGQEGFTQAPPLLSVQPDGAGDGMGFEGLLAYSVEELSDNNPWNEGAQLKTLPVFQNGYYDNRVKTRTEPTMEEMEGRLIAVGEKMGLVIEAEDIKNDVPNDEEKKKIEEDFKKLGEPIPDYAYQANYVSATLEHITVSVDTTLTATIGFQLPDPLPEGCSTGWTLTREQAAANSIYFQKEYSALLPEGEVKTNIYGGDYNNDGAQGYEVSFYDGSGSLEEQLIDFFFYKVDFFVNERGLSIVRLHNGDLSNKLGDYPIISADRARAQLSQGIYLTTVPEAFPGAEYIRKTELVYRTGNTQTYMPYYRILVELPALKQGELNMYGAYYVPAVEAEYIKNLPQWEGSFQ